VTLVEMSAPPPTVIVISALMLELLRDSVLALALAALALLVLGVVTIQQVPESVLASTRGLSVGAIWGISPKILVKSREIITISLAGANMEK